MNPLLSIITLLATLRGELYNKFNAAMEKAKPLEQFEAGSAARGILNEIDWAQERLKRTGEELQATLDGAGKFLAGFERKADETPQMAAARFLEEFEKKIGSEAITAAITAKTIVSIDDHNHALTAAKDTAAKEAKEAAEADFTAKLDAIKLLAERRADAVTRLGEIAAAALTDDVLAGDAHEEAITAIEERVNKLKEENIVPEGERKAMFTSLVAKTGEDFDTSLSIILTAAGGKLAPLAAATPPAKGPAVQPGTTAPISASAAKPKVVI